MTKDIIKRIYKYELRISYKEDKPKIKLEEANFSILKSNDECLVIDDRRFTTLQYENNRPNRSKPINTVHVIDWTTRDTYFNSLIITLYTDDKSRKRAMNKIKKAYTKWFKETHGRFIDSNLEEVINNL